MNHCLFKQLRLIWIYVIFLHKTIVQPGKEAIGLLPKISRYLTLPYLHRMVQKIFICFICTLVVNRLLLYTLLWTTSNAILALLHDVYGKFIPD